MLDSLNPLPSFFLLFDLRLTVFPAYGLNDLLPFGPRVGRLLSLFPIFLSLRLRSPLWSILFRLFFQEIIVLVPFVIAGFSPRTPASRFS